MCKNKFYLNTYQLIIKGLVPVSKKSIISTNLQYFKTGKFQSFTLNYLLNKNMLTTKKLDVFRY